jgi:Gpi18-like mannosyltransferase
MGRQSAVRLIAFTLLSLPLYIWIGYATVRTDFFQLLLLFGLLSALYILALYKKVFDAQFPLVLGAAMLLRISLLFMTPNLTDDYFRYIWDGLLSTHSYNPYLSIPSQFIQGAPAVTGITDSLYTGLNSADYYTVYPPVCQLIFGLAAKIAGGNILCNIIIIRLIILTAEFGILVFLYKLAAKLSWPSTTIAIYAFNPLVILELTGNLHLEAVMLFFLVLSIYLLVINKQIYAGFSFGLAVGTKLLPLIFLPLLIKRLGLAKSIIFYAIVGATIAALFLPFYSTDLIPDLFSGIRLYFQRFEFNASIYYILRWIGYQFTGHNMISILGILLASLTFLIIIAITVTERKVTWLSLFTNMLMCLTVYFLLATTVHPWYITSLVLLSLFTSYSYPIIWSAVIILSYATYRTVPYSENLWLVSVEYVILLSYMGYELYRRLSNRQASDTNE